MKLRERIVLFGVGVKGRSGVAIYYHAQRVIDRCFVASFRGHRSKPRVIVVGVHVHQIGWRVCRVLILVHHKRAHALPRWQGQRLVARSGHVVAVQDPQQRAVKRPYAVVAAASHVVHVVVVQPAHHVLISGSEVRLSLAHNVAVIAVFLISVRS